MCFQEADLWNKTKLLLSGTCLFTGHFYLLFVNIIVCTAHSCTLLFSDISFLLFLMEKTDGNCI